MNKTLFASLLATVLGVGAFGANSAMAHPQHRGATVEFVRTLPHGYQRIDHRGARYGFRDGRYLQQHRNGHWVIVRAPSGIVVPMLPRHVSVVVRGGNRHYRHQDVSY